jgi:hypothetical protein
MAAISNPTLQNYVEAPLIPVPLNHRGQIVTQASAVVEISYKELKTARSTIGAISYKAIDFFRSISLGCCCSCRHRNFSVIKELELDPMHPETDLMRKIEGFEREHPLDFRCDILQRKTDSSPEPKITRPIKLLAESIGFLLKQNKISTTAEHTTKLLMAREIALRVHLQNSEAIVCIPSKSDFFYDINPLGQARNAHIRSFNPKSPGKSLASVRVFPNGASSLTIPLQERIGGGLKILNREIYIGADDTISLMRRVKLRKNRRDNWGVRTTEIMLKVARFTHPGILSPKTLYMHKKKGLEYLVEDCKADFFSVLETYTYLQRKDINFQDPIAAHIVNTPIDSQIRTHLGYMKTIVESVLYMHRENLLHNDLKPENTLLNSKGAPLLCDFDFSCTFEEGATFLTDVGTVHYKKPNTFSRNMSTDLFAIARTFWIDIPDPEVGCPSFMDVFEVLHTLSQTKNPKLTGDIELVIRTLKKLCLQMREGIPVLGGKIFPTLDSIMATIVELDKKFSVGKDSGIS